MVISMNDYKKARAAKTAALRCDEELLRVNRSPTFGALALAIYQTPQELSPELPEEHAAPQSGFFDRARALASQI